MEEPVQSSPPPILIGGRNFRIVQRSTIEHDAYLGGRLRAAGVASARQQEGEQREQFVVRVHQQILDSGQILALLAGILIPAECDDLDWTPAVAQQTQDFLRKLYTPEDKRAMHTALAAFSGFFAAGLLLREPSAGASPAETPSAEQPATQTEDAANAT